MTGSFIHSTAKLALLALVVWVVGGCEEEENPLGSDNIAGNLFPLASGRVWVSTAYDLDTTGQKVNATTHREVLYAHAAVQYAGRDAFLMIDSVYSPSGSLDFVDTTYMSTDGENLYLFLDTWVGVFQRSQGLDNEYVAGTFQSTEPGFPAVVTVRCKIFASETVSVPKGTVNAHKLQIKIVVALGPLSLEETTYVWFAEGLGPVKFQTPPMYEPFLQQTLNGYESQLVSTNF